MRTSLFKAIAGSLAALTLGLSIATTPASAAFRMGGGGFHGGGFHGGGFRGGGFRGGFGGYGGWGYGGWGWGWPYGDYGYYPYDAYYDYGYGPYYGEPYGNNGCLRLRPIYDQRGRYLGRHYVDMCR